MGHLHRLPYFPLIDFATKRFKLVNLSDNLLDELLRSQTQLNISRKASNYDLTQWSGRLTMNNTRIQQHASNGVSDASHHLGKTALEAARDISLKTLYNPNRSKHFEMLEPRSVEAMFIDHQRNKNHVKLELEKEYDLVLKSSPAVINMNSPTEKVESETEWETEQTLRRDRIRTTCNRNGHMNHLAVDTLIRNRHLLTNFLVDDDHQLIYCYVPKVSCSRMCQQK